MTDTAGTVASILEMARVLGRGPKPRRGVRFAWWPGHSFGRAQARRGARIDSGASSTSTPSRMRTNWMAPAGAARAWTRLRRAAGRVWPSSAVRSPHHGSGASDSCRGPPVPSRPRQRFRVSGSWNPGVLRRRPGAERGHPDVTGAGRIATAHEADARQAGHEGARAGYAISAGADPRAGDDAGAAASARSIAVSCEQALDELIAAAAGASTSEVLERSHPNFAQRPKRSISRQFPRPKRRGSRPDPHPAHAPSQFDALHEGRAIRSGSGRVVPILPLGRRP